MNILAGNLELHNSFLFRLISQECNRLEHFMRIYVSILDQKVVNHIIKNS